MIRVSNGLYKMSNRTIRNVRSAHDKADGAAPYLLASQCCDKRGVVFLA